MAAPTDSVRPVRTEVLATAMGFLSFLFGSCSRMQPPSNRPDWSNLESIVAGHVARNRELCEMIEGRGQDLAQVRPIDLHFWADGPAAARRLAKALRRRGWSRVRFDHAGSKDDPGLWNVEVEIEASVHAVVDREFIEAIAKLALENHGTFDGWGMRLDR
jgi:hypothetical protein